MPWKAKHTFLGLIPTQMLRTDLGVGGVRISGGIMGGLSTHHCTFS